MSVLINASTTSGLVQTADTSGTLELQSNGTTQLTVSSTGAYGQLKSGTAVASTSGTSIDFTSLPSWVKRITVMFSGVSTNNTSNLLIQIGSGSITTTGYDSGAYSSNSSNVSSTAGFILTGDVVAGDTHSGSAVLNLLNASTNLWVSFSVLGQSTSPGVQGAISTGGGNKALSGALDRIRITSVTPDTFDAGLINILYEG